jgi:predicted nucleic acid-binding protein
VIVYFDSSAIVKRYLAEADSAQVRTLLAEAVVTGTSLISRAEVSAALAKAVRMNWLTRDLAGQLLRVFRVQWADLITVDVTEAVVAQADSLAWEHGLRGYDAVHLASALLWQNGLSEIVTLATFDKQLWAAAKLVGLEVWPGALV